MSTEAQKLFEAFNHKTPCDQHVNKGYKKGCAECFERNRPDPRADDNWHDTWERDNFGDRD